MARSQVACTLPILAGVMLGCGAPARAQERGPARLAQAADPAVPQAAAADDAIGSVATLQGGASVRRNNAVRPLNLRDPIMKGDVLQTSDNGTLGVTFDDETTFTLTPNSRIAVGDFLYQQSGARNSAVFNVALGTVAFVAAQVAKTGDMKVDTPTASLGIRGTTGLVAVPAGATPGTAGEVAIKLYPDADGQVGRIEVFGRDGGQLGILSRGATGFAIRPGAPGAPQRFSAVPLQITAQEAARDRLFVRQTFAVQRIGRQINIQRRMLRQRNLQQRNLQRQNLRRPDQLRPNPQRRQAPPGAPRQPGRGRRNQDH